MRRLPPAEALLATRRKCPLACSMEIATLLLRVGFRRVFWRQCLGDTERMTPDFSAAFVFSRPVHICLCQNRRIIQGGMGVAVSGWRLARAVSQLGQLGVVSGTALAVVLSRRLQLGDPGGELRRALSRFPFPAMAERVLATYFIPGGKAADVSFKGPAMPTINPAPELVELTVVANFVEVFLAKEGHDGLVGINYLEKIQLPTLPSIFGAMLAGVDYVLMGAGIPRAIPGVLDLLADGKTASLNIDVEGALPGETTTMTLIPQAFVPGPPHN